MDNKLLNKKWNGYRSYLMKKYKWSYEDADLIICDAWIYYKERDKEEDFLYWGLHKCNQLAMNACRKKNLETSPIDFDDDGETKQAFYVAGVMDDVTFVECYAMFDNLTLQEYEILRLLYLGYTQSEIAEIYNCSKQAVNNVVRRIRYKCNVDN